MINRPSVKVLCALLLLHLSEVSVAQTLIHDVRGYTSSGNGIQAFSVIVFDDRGKIIDIGSRDLLEKYEQATSIHGNNRTLLPGLIDAHAHVYGLGQLKTQLDLFATASLSDALKDIEHYAQNHPHADWIQGRGWNQVLWPGQQFPNAVDIDSVVPTRPVWLRRVDGHAGWANTAALRIAGIDRDTPNPVGGKILRGKNGDATGVLIDSAMDLVGQHVPQPSKKQLRDAIALASDTMIAEGITGVHDAGITAEMGEVYLSMADNGELTTRIYAMLAGAGAALDAYAAPIKRYANDRLEIAAVKLYSDGALGSRGAAMLEPYSDDIENRGLPFFSQPEMNGFVKKANEMGFQVGIHAIGDRGNRIALNAIDAAQDGKPSPLRNRIEHAQIIAEDDIARFAKLGVIASMQATHATSDKNMAETRVGADRIRGGYAWRRLLESGAVVANGSDFPVELSNPFHGLFAAVTRQDRANQPAGGWYPEQSMTRAEALHSFTYAAAYAARQEDRLGSLEVGKWADFIIIDRDYFTVDAAEIDDIQVLQTWIGGRKVYDATEDAMQ